MKMDTRILVTGANGFIGSNIISELLATNTPVTALVRNKSNTEYLKSIKCYKSIEMFELLKSFVFVQNIIVSNKAIGTAPELAHGHYQKSSPSRIGRSRKPRTKQCCTAC